MRARCKRLVWARFLLNGARFVFKGASFLLKDVCFVLQSVHLVFKVVCFVLQGACFFKNSRSQFFPSMRSMTQLVGVALMPVHVQMSLP